ncbi:Hypothetical predicted protein, partial [Scomber scombrus]
EFDTAPQARCRQAIRVLLTPPTAQQITVTLQASWAWPILLILDSLPTPSLQLYEAYHQHVHTS